MDKKEDKNFFITTTTKYVLRQNASVVNVVSCYTKDINYQFHSVKIIKMYFFYLPTFFHTETEASALALRLLQFLFHSHSKHPYFSINHVIYRKSLYIYLDNPGS